MAVGFAVNSDMKQYLGRKAGDVYGCGKAHEERHGGGILLCGTPDDSRVSLSEFERRFRGVTRRTSIRAHGNVLWREKAAVFQGDQFVLTDYMDLM